MTTSTPVDISSGRDPSGPDLAAAGRYVRALVAEANAVTRAVVEARVARLPAVRPSGRPVLQLAVFDWRGLANCAGIDPGLFFPERFDEATASAAKAVCGGCVVRAACFREAMEDGERFGVWGGTTEKERRELRRRLPRWSRCAGCGDRYLRVASGQRYCGEECRGLSAKWRREVRAHPERRVSPRRRAS